MAAGLGRIGTLLALAALGLAPTSAAQEAAPQPRLEPFVATRFVSAVNRYGWEADAAWGGRAGPWDGAVRLAFASTALGGSGQLRFRDEMAARWQVRRPLRDALALHADGEAAWYSQSRVARQWALAGPRWTPAPGRWIQAGVGAGWDARPGVDAAARPPLRSDLGPAAGVRFAVLAGDDTETLAVSGLGRLQDLGRRAARDLYVDGLAARLRADSRVEARVRVASVRRDAYQALSFLNRDAGRGESIEATTSDTLAVGIEGEGRLAGALRGDVRLDVGAQRRAIRTHGADAEALFFDTDFARRAVETQMGASYARDGGLVRVSVGGGAEVERRRLANAADLPPTQAAQKEALLQQAGFDRGYLEVAGRVLVPLGRRWSARMEARASILRHDTPSANPDDRDEALATGELGLVYRPHPRLEADVSLYGSRYHTVYLKAARSAENNVQRTIRLRPSVRWRPGRAEVAVRSEVRAGYTVDDFVLAGRRAADQSARELRQTAELRTPLGDGLALLAEGSYATLHLGRFLSDAFAEIPFDTLRTTRAWVRVQTQGRLTAELGVRALVRSDFDRALSVRYPRVDATGEVLRDSAGAVVLATFTGAGRERIRQLGPTATLRWPMRRGTEIRIDGWLQVQTVRRRLYGDLPEGAAERIRRAARRGPREVIPNLTLSMRWAL